MGSAAERVLSRFKRAGGSDFENYVHDPNPHTAFKKVVEEARHESGHGGYSGTIAEKSNFTIRRQSPMTRNEAQKFIESDIEKNDKWGPAFAVPIGEEAKEKERKFKVKVPARDEWAAKEAADKIVKEKYVFGEGGTPAPGVSATVKVEKATLLKEGKLPELKLEKGGPEGFKLIGPGTNVMQGRWAEAKVWPSRAEAVAGFKEFILKNKPQSGSKFEIIKFKTSDVFTIGDVAKSMHLYEVEGTVSIERSTGKILGWIFYGIASS